MNNPKISRCNINNRVENYVLRSKSLIGGLFYVPAVNSVFATIGEELISTYNQMYEARVEYDQNFIFGFVI